MINKYIGYAEYFATGEGLTKFVASGTKEEIMNSAEPFMSRCLTYFSINEIRDALEDVQKDEECIKNHKNINYEAIRVAYFLRGHAPIVAQTIHENTGYYSFSYKFYINFS
ncbi:hypothetical protein [Shewanella subflava]|uniref:Uncharacterized protein n=1 Tax=Shewanella subflava TaxID=2986476 RepID=A0ABT3ID01_9GAMM|nr:hypothetical protein [Shewanella subflava]MCW3173932.1 hypothetical protein [Shewanella subflava]